jgi:single-strand DNA-binding protein
MPSYFGLARLGRDVELRKTASGDAVANLALGFTYGKKGSDGKRPVQWVEASLWGQRAESMASYLTKGTMLSVIIEEAHNETFEKRDGTQGFKMVGRVSGLDFAGGGQPAQQAPAAKPAEPAPTSGGGLAGMSDDIPFNRMGGRKAHYLY